jgi:hypothetical protein
MHVDYPTLLGIESAMPIGAWLSTGNFIPSTDLVYYEFSPTRLFPKELNGDIPDLVPADFVHKSSRSHLYNFLRGLRSRECGPGIHQPSTLLK